MEAKYRQGYIKDVNYDYFERLGEGIKLTIQIIDPKTGKPWIFVDFTTMDKVPEILDYSDLMSFSSLIGKPCLVEKIGPDESKFVKILQ